MWERMVIWLIVLSTSCDCEGVQSGYWGGNCSIFKYIIASTDLAYVKEKGLNDIYTDRDQEN